MKRPGICSPNLAVTAMTVPMAAVGVGGMLVGGLSGGQLLASCLAVAAIEGILVWRWLGEATRLADYVDGLAGRRTPAPPPMFTAMGRDLATLLSQVHQQWSAESRARSALAASYETTLDSVPDPLFYLDAHRRAVGANVAARQLFARDPVGMDIAALLRLPAVLDAVDRALAGQPTEDAEFVLPGPPEHAFVARLRRIPVPGLGGARVVLSVHDVTAIRRSERMRAEFIANASHELRTPLASLLGFIETLAGPAREDAQARETFLPIMLQMGRRMERLIEDLLSLSRIEFEEQSRPSQPVDMTAVVGSVVEMLSPQAEGRGMSIAVQVEPDLPIIAGQADQLAQVAQNLIDNALKYGRAGSVVEVSLGRGPSGVALAVRDQGEGIAREHLPRLTERFYRCDASRSRELGGTGLGLAIVKHILNRHGGSLSIASTVGEGSTFTAHLPA